MDGEKRKIDKGNLLKRVLSGAVLGVLLIGTAVLGVWPFWALTGTVSFLGLLEFYRAFGMERTLLSYVGCGMALIYWILLGLGFSDRVPAMTAAAFLGMAAVYVLDFSRTDGEKFKTAFTGFFYTVVLLSYIFRVRAMHDGIYLVFLVFIASWGSDIFAYFVGIVFGKHPMSPVLSPKKTVEGLLGGFAGAAALGAIYGGVFNDHFQMLRMPVIACCLISAFASVISVVGDLFASALKRNRGIKDYSQLIPGHGGILDRFDSCIFVAPVIFFLTEIFM